MQLVVVLLAVGNVFTLVICWLLWSHSMSLGKELLFVSERQGRIMECLGTGKWPEGRCPERDQIGAKR